MSLYIASLLKTGTINNKYVHKGTEMKTTDVLNDLGKGRFFYPLSAPSNSTIAIKMRGIK